MIYHPHHQHRDEVFPVPLVSLDTVIELHCGRYMQAKHRTQSTNQILIHDIPKLIQSATFASQI